MCAINGTTQQNRELIEHMNHMTRHRGPDGSEVWVSEDMTLGHNRLSIIDLREVANQPFVSDDGRYVVVYNGELYNFKELRAELSQYAYRTEGDTEVLLNAYRFWGEECVHPFQGKFCFANRETTKKKAFSRTGSIWCEAVVLHSCWRSIFVFIRDQSVAPGGCCTETQQKCFHTLYATPLYSRCRHAF